MAGSVFETSKEDEKLSEKLLCVFCLYILYLYSIPVDWATDPSIQFPFELKVFVPDLNPYLIILAIPCRSASVHTSLLSCCFRAAEAPAKNRPYS